MSYQKQFETYQTNAVTTASSGQLTLMLYNGCVKFIKQAMIELEANKFEAKNRNIQKAQNIIQELIVTLNPEIALSNELLPLYDYINYRLTEGNIKNDKASLEEALTYTEEFRDLWKEVLLKAAETKKQEIGAKV